MGDEDQTIYTFTGATSDYLTGVRRPLSGRPDRHPRDQLSARRPRSWNSPTASSPPAAWRPTNGYPARAARPAKRLVAEPARRARRRRSPGSHPTRPSSTAMIGAIRALARPERRTARWPSSSARTRSCRRIERALGAAGIAFHVRGEGFFARPEVRRAVGVARSLARAPGDEAAGRPPGRRLRARARRPSRPAAAGRGRRRTPRGGRHPARAGRGPGPGGSIGRPGGLPRRGRAAVRDRGRRHADRRRAPDLPPGQGPRVGCGLPARARGGHAAHPAGRPNPRSWPRSAGCSTSASPGRVGTCGSRGRPGEPASTGREGRRSRSRFLDGLVPPRAGRPPVAGGVAADRPAGARLSRLDPAERSPLSNALRAWRTARARADAVAPFIVFHDTTIEAIAERRPTSIAELRRVPGVGPTKLDRYGEEIIGVVSREA